MADYLEQRKNAGKGLSHDEWSVVTAPMPPGKSENPTCAEEDRAYAVAHFPTSGRWYALYVHGYIKVDTYTGKCSTYDKHGMHNADCFWSESDAWKLCNYHRMVTQIDTAIVYATPNAPREQRPIPPTPVYRWWKRFLPRSMR